MSNLALACALLSLISLSISVPVIQPQNLSKQFLNQVTYGLPSATYGNYFLTSSFDDNGIYLNVLKIDSKGVLSNVTRVEVDQGYSYTYFFTNGKWFGCGFNLGITMFQLDANDQPVEKRLFSKGGALGPVWMLSDDTIVAYSQSPVTGLFVYKYESGPDDWTEIQFIPIRIPGGSTRAAVTDTTLITIDDSPGISNYSRATNGTFVFIDKLPIDEKFFPDVDTYNLWYNGYDTVVVASTHRVDPDPYKGVYMFYTTKDDGSRVGTFFYQRHLGFVGDISMGSIVVTAIDRYNILIGAPQDGIVESKRSVQEEINYGKVVWMQRDDSPSQWAHIADVDSKVGNYFGSVVTGIGNHVGMTQCTSSVGAYFGCDFWVVPKCLVRPINVTCDTRELDSCDIDFSKNYFTVADPLCENTVTVTKMAFADYTFTASYTLERPFVASESCNASLLCPRPAVPVNTNVPVAVPKGVTSGGSALMTWIGASVASVIVFSL